jgi:hypothetical protein
MEDVAARVTLGRNSAARGAAMVVTLVAGVGFVLAAVRGEGQATLPWGPKEDGSARPLIDAAIPEATETATFALG